MRNLIEDVSVWWFDLYDSVRGRLKIPERIQVKWRRKRCVNPWRWSPHVEKFDAAYAYGMIIHAWWFVVTIEHDHPTEDDVSKLGVSTMDVYAGAKRMSDGIRKMEWMSTPHRHERAVTNRADLERHLYDSEHQDLFLPTIIENMSYMALESHHRVWPQQRGTWYS